MKGNRMSKPFFFRPISDWIVVEKDEAEEKSPGGILLPDKAKEKPDTGVVRAVGPGRLLMSSEGTTTGAVRPVQIKVGQRIMFDRFGGRDWKKDGKTYKLCRETEVWGIFQD